MGRCCASHATASFHSLARRCLPATSSASPAVPAATSQLPTPRAPIHMSFTAQHHNSTVAWALSYHMHATLLLLLLLLRQSCLPTQLLPLLQHI